MKRLMYGSMLLASMFVVFGITLNVPLSFANDDHGKTVPCASLQGMIISAKKIALPTKGATITSATIVAATPQTVDASGNIVLATPEYCKVLGSIARRSIPRLR